MCKLMPVCVNVRCGQFPQQQLGFRTDSHGCLFQGSHLAFTKPLEGKALRGFSAAFTSLFLLQQQPRVPALTELQHLTVTRPCSCRAAGKGLLVLCNSCTALSGLQQTVPRLKLDSQMSAQAINRNKFDPTPVYFFVFVSSSHGYSKVSLMVGQIIIVILVLAIFAVLCALYSYVPYM